MQMTLTALMFCAAMPSIAEPIYGKMTGAEDDFLEFACEAIGEGRKECSFTQVTMSLKQDSSEIEAILSDRIPELLREFEEASSNDGLPNEFCTSTLPWFGLFETLIDGDRETARMKLAELPERMRDEFDFDEATEQVAQADPRELEDLMTMMSLANQLCDKRDVAAAEEFIRWQLEQDARTCKLYLNTWTDIFKQVSDKVWTLEDSSAEGVCAVSRLDRFECKGAYLCDYIAEKRILNKEGEGLIPCRELEERAFRYEHGQPIYMSCNIMSWF